MTLESPQAEPWRAHLDLVFRRMGERTVLVRDRHEGPLRVQRPFHEADGSCQVIVVHPPGGIAGGDELRIDVAVEPGAEALLTSPGAAKLYRSAGPESRVEQRIALASGASFEWLPQETIAFSGARARVATRVELGPRSRFLGWDMVSLGRPTSGERFLLGELRQRFELYREGHPVWLDRQRFEGGEASLDAAFGLAGQPVFGVLLGYPATPTELDALHELLPGEHERTLGSTLVDEVLVCRALAPSTRVARAALEAAWRALRPRLLGRVAQAPRIWAC